MELNITEKMILSLIFVASLFSLFMFITIPTSVPAGMYNFLLGLSTSDENQEHTINQFRFFYDFVNKKGKLSFSAPQNITTFYMRFPKEVNCTRADIYYDSKYNEKLESDKFRNACDNTTIALTEIKENLLGAYFIFEFETSMEPKGEFYFFKHENITLESENDYMIELFLGDRYQCPFRCLVEPLTKGRFFEISESTNERVKLQIDKSKSEHSFVLNSENRENYYLKEFFLALSVSFFVSLIAFFLQRLSTTSKTV